MSAAEFRKNLMKVMPGYRWTVHKAANANRLEATGIQTSGFNRCSTLSVTRSLNRGFFWFEVKSSGFGLKSPWLGCDSGPTLAQALRNLQNHYEAMANTYRGHAAALQHGRSPKCKHCCNTAITDLDGEDLCQTHADEWVRGEGRAVAEADADARAEAEQATSAAGGKPDRASEPVRGPAGAPGGNAADPAREAKS